MKRLSIRYRLPILITALLLAFAAAAFWAASSEVRRSSLQSARDRLGAVSSKMAEILAGSARRMKNGMHGIAHRGHVVSFLRNGSRESMTSAQALIDSLGRAASVAGIEIWGPDGAPLLASRGSVRVTSQEAAQELTSRITESDTAILGAYEKTADSLQVTRVHYPVVAPVRDSSSHVLGYFVLHRHLNSSAQEAQQIRELIGSEVGLFIGSPETNIWTDLSTHAAPPPVAIVQDDSLLEYHRDDRGWQLASSVSVAGTPWIALLEFPRDPLLEGTRRVAGKFAAIGFVLLMVGGFAAYALSRDITGPILHLAEGADAIARGDYKRIVDVSRRDELGTLATAFNAMARNVDESVERLAEDIRERKRAEEALREADETIRAMVQSSPLPIIALDASGRIKLWNPAAETVFGWKFDEVRGQLLPTVTDEQRDEHDHLRQRAMNGEVFTSLDVKRRRRDGTLLFMKLSCAATYNSKGEATGVTAVFEDVTASRQLEAQLRQSQKMEAIGRLAGGVAHDFNNLLTVVLGASDLLLQQLREGDETHDTVREIREAGQRAAALTAQLLAFSRKQLAEPQILVINEMVGLMDTMVRRLIGEDIRVSTKLDPGLGSVLADRGQVEQVLMNLVVNARDAMPRGGSLVIETANVTLDRNYASMHEGVKPGNYVMLAVSDTGMGMSEETRSRMFEPFFTTKPSGKGTGLGLSTCYGIVRQAGGHIGVYSEPNVGTTMKVYFPRVGSAGATGATPPASAMRGVETILLVEDDKAVRAITRRMLSAQGYSVLEAPDGPAALEILRTSERRIHLLFTDVVLPGMGGRDVAEKARELRPDIKVLFASGYTDDVILQHQLLEHDVSLLQKPFTPQSMAQKVREVLDGLKVKGSTPPSAS
jgi:PAS domain S-box-containing protein